MEYWVKNMKKVKSLIITGFGINCEEEMAAAYDLAGAETDIVHLNDLFLNRISIHDYDILNFPGGFSFGDDLGSGKVLANKMKYKKMKNDKLFFLDLQDFLSDGKYIMGVCNGFQFLVKMGLLPNTEGDMQQQVTLTRNNSAQFEDRWCYLKVNQPSLTPFLENIELLQLPVRHGEGKLIIKNQQIEIEIVEQNLNCLSYCDEEGNVTGKYPLNPNGAELNCAGLTNATGQVFGLMPHPEAFLSLYNHPNWGQMQRSNPNISPDGDGLKIFKNIVKYILNRQARKDAKGMGE
jgi:phosphoribosylformylglycinamidine synthase subunit PurQ / glutaminase